MAIKGKNKREKEFLLVQRAQKGDQSAFEELFKMYYKTVYYIVYKMVQNPTDAEDLTIEAFTKAFENIQYYIPTNAFITWLSRIAINRAIDFLRKKKASNHLVSIDEPHPQAEDDNATLSGTIEAKDIDPEEQYIKQEIREILQKFIDELPPDYRQIMNMRYFEQLSYKEIAEKLNLPLGTVKARLHRGRDLLRTLIQNKKHYFK